MNTENETKLMTAERKRLAEVINACYPSFKSPFYAVKLWADVLNDLDVFENNDESAIFNEMTQRLLNEFKPKFITPLSIEQAWCVMPRLETCNKEYISAVNSELQRPRIKLKGPSHLKNLWRPWVSGKTTALYSDYFRKQEAGLT